MVRSVHHIVEEQIVRWRLERARQQSAPHKQKAEFKPANVVAICNAYGIDVSGVAAHVGRAFDIPVYDREIVSHIANSERVRVETVETLDERAQNRIDDYFTSLMHEKGLGQNEYFKALTRTITALWAHGPCVFVGHGAGHLVQRENVLAVRITAPPEVRARAIASAEGLTQERARDALEKVDGERRIFIRKMFKLDVDDPHVYDLVINARCVQSDLCAELIVAAYRLRFPSNRT